MTRERPLRWEVTEQECWAVTSHSDIWNGYVCVRRGGRTVRAHRFMFEKKVGAIPDGMHVLHKCDNRKCVNPDHLFLGTTADNNHDMVAKDRQARGEANGRSVLAINEVQNIRHRYDRTGNVSNCRTLAAEYGVSVETIRSIVAGRRWRECWPIAEKEETDGQ